MAAYRHIGKLSRKMEGAFNVALCKVMEVAPMSRDYIEKLIGTDFVKGELLRASGRSHIPSMHLNHLLSLPVPLPPLKEQKRIVAKVDELFEQTRALAGRLASAEKTRTQLQRASVGRLRSAETPQQTQAAWQQVAAHFDTLHTTPADIASLKQTILQLAVMGRLVPQDSADERIESYLARIEAERRAGWERTQLKGKQRRAKQKAAKIRRSESGNPLQRGEKLGIYEWKDIPEVEFIELMPKSTKWKDKYVDFPYPDSSKFAALPPNWAWVNLGQIAWDVKDGPHYSPKYVDEGIPFISARNISIKGVDFSTAKYISRSLYDELCERCQPEVGDILYTKGGTTGVATVNTYEQEFNVWVHVAVLKLVDSVYPFYIQHALNSADCYAQSQEFTHGLGNQDLGLTRMVNIYFAMPPFAEQKRIVAKVDEMLALCDEVEAGLVSAEAARVRLLDALLAGA